jgi:type IV pilus assembly protein PilW
MTMGMNKMGMTKMGMNGKMGRPCPGFTLVELMVALVLSLVVIGGALMVYLSSSTSYRAQEATAQMMENGRTAVEMISRDLRMAEYWKCIGWQAANLSNHLPYQQRGIYSDNGASGAPDTLRMLQALDETVVTLTADVELTELIINDPPPHTVDPQDIPVTDASGFSAGDIIVVNDCAKGDVFTITGVSGNNLEHNCSNCVEAYVTGSEVLRVEDVQYYVDDTTDPDNPKLMRIVNGAAAEELLEGVEDLQVHFGEDTDSDGIANRYVTADVINEPCADGSNPGCWLRVPTARISLLMRTVDDHITQQPQSYLYNGTTVTATDGRLRRAFTAVVALRNQFNN